MLPASQPRCWLSYSYTDADNTFPYGMPSHLTDVAFLLLCVSCQQLQAEIKALCAVLLAGAPTPEHGKKDVQQGV